MPFPKKGQSDKCEILQHLDTEKLEMFGYSFAFFRTPTYMLATVCPHIKHVLPAPSKLGFF
jgi:hypothetical protein